MMKLKNNKNPQLSLGKKLGILVIALLINTTLFAQKEGMFKLDGKLEGLGNSMVYLTADYQGKMTPVDSVMAKNGEFSFNPRVKGMLLYTVKVGKKFYLNLPISVNDKVSVVGDMAKPNEVVVSGSSEYPVWKHWGASWNAIRSRAGELYKALDSISNKKGDRTWIDAEFGKLSQRTIDSVESLVKKYPNSPMVPFIIADRFVNYPNPEKAQSCYAALGKEAKNSPYGIELGENVRIAAKTGIGVKPDFTLADQQGKEFKLSSLKGKVVMVDFWASWCVPCRKENPNLVKAYAAYHDKGFEIVGVSLDEKKDAWLNAIKADALTWYHVSDLKGWKSDIVAMYGIKSVPTSFIIDRNGKIVAKNLRGEALEKTLATLLK